MAPWEKRDIDWFHSWPTFRRASGRIVRAIVASPPFIMAFKRKIGIFNLRLDSERGAFPGILSAICSFARTLRGYASVECFPQFDSGSSGVEIKLEASRAGGFSRNSCDRVSYRYSLIAKHAEHGKLRELTHFSEASDDDEQRESEINAELIPAPAGNVDPVSAGVVIVLVSRVVAVSAARGSFGGIGRREFEHVAQLFRI